MNREHLHRQPAVESSRVPRPAPLRVAKEAPAPRPIAPAVLPTAALDDRIAIVDPLGVWWGLRAGAAGNAGYPVIVFGGRHADVPITADMGAPLGQLIAKQALASVVDLSEFGSNTARRQFMAAFAEAVYEANEEPLHLVFDEADLWAPQRPIKGWEGLLGHIEEIVRRGRVRGFIPWLITQRPAVVHKCTGAQ